MRKRKQSALILLCVFGLMVSIAPTSAMSQSTLTKQEIYTRKLSIYSEYMKQQSQSATESELYDVVPSTSLPYVAGVLKTTILQSALATTNFVRYLAYLNNDVQLDSDWNEMAQYAAIVNAANNKLSHSPLQPGDMSKEFYQKGLEGANTSNVYFGFLSLNDTLFKYLYDSDPSNIVHTGHRRWLLNPAMTQIGFGYTDVGGFNKVFSAAKVFGGIENSVSAYKKEYDYIAWPSKGAFPSEYFSSDQAWSISLNPKLYDPSKTEDIKIVVENTTTGQVQSFSQTQNDGFFKIETSAFGVPFCIIFRPNSGDCSEYSSYKVTVSGLYSPLGKAKTVTYETTFFELEHFGSVRLENQGFAEKLHQMGVFRGTNKGYELDRAPSRLEGLVMLIRLLGKEEEALARALEPCVFTDVPDWGRGYVNYAYSMNLTKGVGNHLFGTNDVLEAKAYMTFMLRALGYDDAQGDFNWLQSLEKAKELSIIKADQVIALQHNYFVRGDAATISHGTLMTKMKDQSTTLLESLVAQGVIDSQYLP